MCAEFVLTGHVILPMHLAASKSTTLQVDRILKMKVFDARFALHLQMWGIEVQNDAFFPHWCIIRFPKSFTGFIQKLRAQS